MKTLALTPKYTATTPMVNEEEGSDIWSGIHISETAWQGEDERSDLANDLVPLGQQDWTKFKPTI